MLITGGKELLSQEGTTQGDPLSMPFYAASTYILIMFLRIAFEDVKQLWLADDASAAGKLVSLHKFFTTLIKEGEKYGYHVNEKKSWLILKNENDRNKAKSICSDLSIKITTEGQRHLGAALGSESFKEAYVNEKVAEWHKELEHLSIIDKSQP